MGDERFWEWASNSPYGFAIGVVVLVLGSNAALSEKNLSEKLSGLALPGKWLRRRRAEAAEKEAEEYVTLQRTVRDQHHYIIWVTSLVHGWEVWAADKGYTLPPPDFLTLMEWKEQQQKDN